MYGFNMYSVHVHVYVFTCLHMHMYSMCVHVQMDTVSWNVYQHVLCNMFILHVHVGIHVEITTEESSQAIGSAKSSTSNNGEVEEDDENVPTLSSEQLARRPSFK